MNCRHARKQLVPYADGDLTDASGLQTHLDSCDGCRRELDDLQRSLNLIVQHDQEEASRLNPRPGFPTRLARRLDEVDEYSFWIQLMRKLRWICSPRQTAVVGWCVALLLLCLHLGQHVQVKTITDNATDSQRLAETRIELHIDDRPRHTLVRFVGM